MASCRRLKDVRVRILLLAGALLLGACGAADAPGTSAPTSTTTTAAPLDNADLPSPKGAADDTVAKLTSHLLEALLFYQRGAALDEIATSVAELRWDGDGVMVEVQVTTLTPELIAAAESAGLQISGQFADIDLLTGAIALDDLLDLAGLDDVVSVVPAFGATTG